MPRNANKVCLICEDKASGFNFNAITCESCKAFFRRNALREKTFRCLKGDVCRIDLSTRKHCKKCRLKKCFAKGMKTELILTDEQKILRNIKIRENKYKIIEDISKVSETSSDDNNFQLIQFNSYNQEISVENYGDISNSDEIHESVYREAVELEFTIIPFERPVGNGSDFNELEKNRIEELLNAMKVLETPTSTNIIIIKSFNEANVILGVKCDQEIRKIVKMSKKLNAFRNINESDQLTLLKHSAIKIISLRMTEFFDLNGQHWRVIINSENENIIKLDLLREAKRKYYLDYKNFYNKFIPEWDSDNYIVDLLTAILLFDPQRPRLNHKEQVKFQRNIYMYLLQRYLQIKYKSDSDSITRFLRLLNIVNDLHIIDEKISKNWSEIEWSEPKETKDDINYGFLPLLKEISNRND